MSLYSSLTSDGERPPPLIKLVGIDADLTKSNHFSLSFSEAVALGTLIAIELQSSAMSQLFFTRSRYKSDFSIVE